MAESGDLWSHKPWWCQPWSILLSGVAMVGGSWWWLRLWWVSLPLAAAVLLWWWLFLVAVPAAYAAEVVRGGILSVDAGQTEAALALGIPRTRQFRRIVFPQAMRSILPSAANQLIGLVKSTSIVYVLAIGELFYQVTVIYGRTTRVVPMLTVATFWYVVITTVLSVLQYYIERHFARGATRHLPLTPWQRIRRDLSGIAARFPRRASVNS